MISAATSVSVDDTKGEGRLGDVLQRLGVVLDSVDRVVRVPPIVKAQREPLHVVEQPRAEAEGQPLSGHRVEHVPARLLKLRQQHHEHLEEGGKGEDAQVRRGDEPGQDRVEDAGQLVRADHVVDRDGQRHGAEQHRRRGQVSRRGARASACALLASRRTAGGTACGWCSEARASHGFPRPRRRPQHRHPGWPRRAAHS